MKKLIILLLFPFVCYAQHPIQRNMSIPRGDARTIEFTTGTDVTGDSIVFTMSLYYQETYMNSTNAALRRANRHAFGGSDIQAFVTDSLTGQVKVYLTMANTLGLTERQYFYSLRVNDTTKYFGTVTMVPTVFTTAFLNFLTTTDTSRFVSRTNPVIPGLATGDTMQVIKVDATGKFFLGWVTSGSTIDTTTLFSQKFKDNEDAHAGFADGDSIQNALLAHENMIAGKADGDSVQNALLANQNAIAGKAGADSIATQILLVKNLIAGKAGADSLHSQLVILYNMIAGKAGGDSVQTALKALQNLIGGKGDSDSLSTAYAAALAALAKSDTTNQVRVTHPNIPGLATDSLGRVLKIDASGNVFNGYLPAAGVSTTALSDSIKALSNATSWKINPKAVIDIDTTRYWQLQDSGYVHRDSISYATLSIPGFAYRIIEVKYALWGQSAWSKDWSVNSDSANNVRVLDVTIEQRMFRDPRQAGGIYGTYNPWKCYWAVNQASLGNAVAQYLDGAAPSTIEYELFATTTGTLYTWLLRAQTALSEAVLMYVTIRCVIPSASTSLYYANINGF